ncbi:Protein of unknown function DUF262 [Maribacter dokdonensis]|uniref:DUF262 domain-containing protein n=1 Tax=Maribacter dokdonensis TaxID=320912 RepID=UPI001B230499|nr:DUF262 domain-containing protein [Maribacter dokdonensis]CAG2534039.1 Protein of unknown function DUF262 [Maribacter dokdonensis]
MEKDSLKTIRELLQYTFKIENYQRGYRWDVTQVLSLLKDINEYAHKTENKEPFYCLQPIVVKDLGNKVYELIDGQQRSTTIHLILLCLSKPNFKITYVTRGTNDSGENQFIKSLENSKPIDINLSKIDDDYSVLDKDFSNSWKIKIQGFQKLNTVDNFYLFRAYVIIENWFRDHDKDLFLSTLLDRTKVIWYESNHSVTQEKVVKKFINFNEGKIELEQSELIKALFVLDILKLPNSIQRQYEENQFADSWNLIEHQLSDPRFWQFVSQNKNDETLANKINLIFQIFNGFGKSEDKYYNYRKFENQFNNYDSEQPQWSEIADLYNKVEEWYFDRTTYHLCGAIIHLTSLNTRKILSIANASDTKAQFRNKLREFLNTHFYKENKWKDKFDPTLLNYGKKEVFNVLFLFNIALTQISEKDVFFPFNRFYNVNNWNIEHILAKNDDGLDSFEEFQTYFTEVKDLIKDAIEYDELAVDALKPLDELCEKLQTTIIDSNKKDCKSIIKELNERLSELFTINDFNNLCLLDQKTNIQVGKKPFGEKRNITLQLDEKNILDAEAYIPIGTQLVFSKKATPSQDFQPNYWSFKDRTSYLIKVNEIIREFLKPEPNGE